MAKDPAFLFYTADASEDTQFLNRLERGCYFDLMKAQKKFPRFTLEVIKKVLGRDFETCWAALESILSRDEAGYFIEWVDNSIEKRKEFSKIQSDRIKNYHDKKKKDTDNELKKDTTVEPAYNHGSTNVEPLGNENAIENEKGNKTEKGNKGVQGEIFQSFVDDWNVYAEKNTKPKINTLTAERKRKLKIRLGEKAFVFRDILLAADSSAYIREGAWFSFDWLLKNEVNYMKVLEGNYNKNNTQNGNGNNQPAAGGFLADDNSPIGQASRAFS